MNILKEIRSYRDTCPDRERIYNDLVIQHKWINMPRKLTEGPLKSWFNLNKVRVWRSKNFLNRGLR